MYEHIPLEMKNLHQWVVSGISKVPYNPTTGQTANPVDPSTWGSFEQAVKSGAPNIGFVLTKEDPYCIIDLDDKPGKPAPPEAKARHLKILDFFKSYTELSTSSNAVNQGYHIIVKGSLPSGVNKDFVEMYSSGRYMIMTGNCVQHLPIAEGYQPILDAMYGQMQPEAHADLEDVDDIVSDHELIEMASTAENSEKFNLLCSANWEAAGYPSGSEADLSLMSMLGFYTRSNEQAIRLFRMTPLAQRLKDGKPRHANNKAIDYTLRLVRAKQSPMVDISSIVQSLGIEANVVIVPAEAPPPAPQQLAGVTLPPGLVGRVAQYIYASSIRPVPEVALAASIAFVAGICGRAYNTHTKAGLSQYMILLARTGRGKEGARDGISTLFQALRTKLPSAMDFDGPSFFASGPGLHRKLSENPCFVSVVGEFGDFVNKINDPRANMADKTLKSLLLDVYGKSGFGKSLGASAYSDKEKNVATIVSPNLTILGESNPGSFYDQLDASSVSSGFLPRFFIIEYDGGRPPENPLAGTPPDEGLLNEISALMVSSITASANNTCMPVIPGVEAHEILNAFRDQCDNFINQTENELLAEIWNRAHLKVLKLAALIAVGVNPYQPIVTPDIARWAVALITKDSSRLAARFEAGNVGEGDAKQQAEVLRIVNDYLKSPADEKSLTKWHTTAALRAVGIAPERLLQRRLQNTSAFLKDRRGANESLKKAIQALKDAGVLAEIDSMTLSTKYGYQGKAYGLRV